MSHTPPASTVSLLGHAPHNLPSSVSPGTPDAVTSSLSLPSSGPVLFDELGELVSDALEPFHASPRIEAFLQATRGPSDI